MKVRLVHEKAPKVYNEKVSTDRYINSNGSVDIRSQLTGNGISNSTDQMLSQQRDVMMAALVEHSSTRTCAKASGTF